MEIKDENTFIGIYGNEKNELKILSYVVDEANGWVTFITDGYWERGCTVHENSEVMYNFRYLFVYEQGEIVNTILYEDDRFLWQNENGVELDFDGIYMTESGDRRLVFYPEKKAMYYQQLSTDGTSWLGDQEEYSRGRECIKVNGQYWVENGWNESFVQDENTVTYDGYTFTKQSETVPEEPETDYTLLGSGDTITGYSPTAYTSSNPYTVSLAGCSGAFSTQNFTWEVMSVSGDTITMKANWMTTEQLSLTGANGWNNSLTALNDVCLSVYGGSTSKYTATARSITFEDMGQTGSPTSSSYEASSYGSNNKFPTAYLTEYQGLTDITEDTSGCGYATNSDITVTNTSFIISSAFSANFSSPYWVNKRCVVATSTDKASFSVGWVASTGAGSPTEATLFDSSGTETTQTKSIRPVVTLTINDWTCLNSADGTSWTISNE